MTPVSVAHTELRLFVQHCEAAHRARTAAELLRFYAELPVPERGWEDLRTEALACLWDTLDRVEKGLGLRLMKALFPVFPVGDEKGAARPGPDNSLLFPPVPADPHWEAGT